MIKYIYRDLAAAAEYLPYGLALGVPISAALLLPALFGRKKREVKGIFTLIAFGMYLAIMLVITFLSRESGSMPGEVDLKLLSTWGINTRNNAFVIENVLLFIPYGFLGCLAYERLRDFFSCALLGAVTSMAVECLQLVTARGYFQIDDILTNIIGTIVGYLIFMLFLGRRE